MLDFFKKPGRFAAIYSVVLTLAFTYVMLDSFVIPRAQTAATQSTATQSTAAQPAATQQATTPPTATATQPPSEKPRATRQGGGSGERVPKPSLSQETIPVPQVTQTETSYKDENIQITIETVRSHDTTLYVADIMITDPSLLKTAFARKTYGRNIRDTTSVIAAEHNAIFAINGDYYGFRDTGYVLRNGQLYRANGYGDALLIDWHGNLSILEQDNVTQDSIDNAWQMFSFGPMLVEDGAMNDLSYTKSRDPRTAIGQISELHYIVIVADGRSDESEGLSLAQLAREFYDRGATVAYNLDGGGSSSMVLNGVIVNKPGSGNSQGERRISDIVYIGYE